MSFISNSWQGSEKLWRVFWLYGVIPALTLGVVGAYAILNNLDVLIIFLTVLNIIYLIWFYVSAWKCAFNCSWKGWGYTMRAVVTINVVYLFSRPFLNY